VLSVPKLRQRVDIPGLDAVDTHQRAMFDLRHEDGAGGRVLPWRPGHQLHADLPTDPGPRDDAGVRGLSVPLVVGIAAAWAIGFPVVFYRPAKALWLGFYYFCLPGDLPANRREEDEYDEGGVAWRRQGR
jgi:hypothetical protein